MSTTTSRRYPELGRRIKSARLRAGLTLDGLGQTVGTSRQHLIRIERGDHRPRPDMLARIAAATGTALAELAGDDDEEADPVTELLRAIRRVVRDELRSERGAVAPAVVVWCAVFVLLATGWTF